jgi:transglutaminase-like putative cysteine protease/tetratricopeptide (TPR) repeat protein
VLCLTLLFTCELYAGEKPKVAESTWLGAPKPSKDTLRAIEQFYAGDIEKALAGLKKAANKNSNEYAALYALALDAIACNDHQQGLELLCKAFSAVQNTPRAEYYLEEINSVLPYCQDAEPFIRLAKSASEASMRPDVAAALHIAYYEWLMKSGQFAAAAEVVKPLQFIARWTLAGPFDNRDKSGFTVAYEPESAVDLEKSVPAKNRRVNWFQPAAHPADGRVMLSDLFEPKIHVLAYGMTLVKAQAAGFAVLRVGCAGACTVWVNDKQAGTVPYYNDYGPDKIVVPVYLYEGWNKILVKSAVVDNTDWSFSVRLCKPEGGPFPDLCFDSSQTALQDYSKQQKDRKTDVGQPPVCQLGIARALQQALVEDPENITLLVAYGTLLDARNMDEKEERGAPKELSKAVQLAPDCPHLQLRLASLSDDSNEARHAAEAAFASHPEIPGVLTSLAVLAEHCHSDLVAIDHARQALQRFGIEKIGEAALVLAGRPGDAKEDAPASRMMKAHVQKRGDSEVQQHLFRAESLRYAQAFADRHPYYPEAWTRVLAFEPTSSGRRATLKKALTYCGGDPALRQAWVNELGEMGQHAQAAEFTAAELLARPFAVSRALAAANSCRQAGDAQRVAELLENARKIAPENPELLSALALARHQGAKTEQAVELYRQVLQIKPNSPQVKDYLALLDTKPGSESNFYATYDVALKDIKAPDASAYPNDNIVHLLNQQVVRVNDNGSCSRMVHRISKLLRPNGARELSQQYIWYEPERQVVDILRAAVITPDGRELSRAEVQDHTTSAAMGVQTLIYDEHHLKQVTFRDVAPGTMIDLQYTIRDTGENIYGDYFADTFYLSEDDPGLRNQYVLDFPKDLNLQTRTFKTNVEGKRVPQNDPRREVFSWDLNNTPGVPQERGMPPVVDQLAQLQVTTMKSWQEVGVWYWHLIKDQLAPSDEMRRTVAEITKDCKTETDKLRAIHDWVIRKIRYLGIEFGRNGYRPHKVAETFKSLYGDCKDTAALMCAMTRLAGIDSRMVLIRTVNAGAVPPDSLPMPNLYNHCIAYVPKVDGKDYWEDCTTDFHRLGEVPDADQNAQVLLINEKGGEFVRIPGSTPVDNLIEQTFDAKVDSSGSGTLTLHDIRHGQFAPMYRQLAETPGNYERYMKDYAAKRFNGAEVEKLELAPKHDQGPMWMKATLKAPALASQSGERKALPATLDPLHLSMRYASQNTRKHDLEMYFPWARRLQVSYALPDGVKASSLPEAVDLSEPFGKYSRKVTRKDGTVTIEENFEFSKRQVKVSEYDAFRQFCNKVDSLMDQKVLLETK